MLLMILGPEYLSKHLAWILLAFHCHSLTSDRFSLVSLMSLAQRSGHLVWGQTIASPPPGLVSLLPRRDFHAIVQPCVGSPAMNRC